MYIMNEYQKARNRLTLLICWGIWFVVSIVLIIFAIPHIKQAIKDSGAAQLLASHQSGIPTSTSSDYRTVLCSFILPDAKGSYTQKQFPVIIRHTGTSTYHTAVEAVLSGPSVEALEQGAVTMIPKHTRLIGLTVSNAVAFVDLSKEFLSAETELSLSLAETQIIRTLTQYDGVKDAVILVAGNLLH